MRYDEAGAYEYGYAYGHGNDVDECKEQPGELHGNFANVVCLRVETNHSRSPLQQQQSYAYGIAYQAVTDRSTLAAAIEKMLTTQGPFIMECAIKEDDNVLPMTPPGKSVNEMLLEI